MDLEAMKAFMQATQKKRIAAEAAAKALEAEKKAATSSLPLKTTATVGVATASTRPVPTDFKTKEPEPKKQRLAEDVSTSSVLAPRKLLAQKPLRKPSTTCSPSIEKKKGSLATVETPIPKMKNIEAPLKKLPDRVTVKIEKIEEATNRPVDQSVVETVKSIVIKEQAAAERIRLAGLRSAEKKAIADDLGKLATIGLVPPAIPVEVLLPLGTDPKAPKDVIEIEEEVTGKIEGPKVTQAPSVKKDASAACASQAEVIDGTVPVEKGMVASVVTGVETPAARQEVSWNVLVGHLAASSGVEGVFTQLSPEIEGIVELGKVASTTAVKGAVVDASAREADVVMVRTSSATPADEGKFEEARTESSGSYEFNTDLANQEISSVIEKAKSSCIGDEAPTSGALIVQEGEAREGDSLVEPDATETSLARGKQPSMPEAVGATVTEPSDAISPLMQKTTTEGVVMLSDLDRLMENFLMKHITGGWALPGYHHRISGVCSRSVDSFNEVVNLKRELADQKKIMSGQNAEIARLEGLITSQAAEVKDLKKDIVASYNSYKSQEKTITDHHTEVDQLRTDCEWSKGEVFSLSQEFQKNKDMQQVTTSGIHGRISSLEELRRLDSGGRRSDSASDLNVAKMDGFQACVNNLASRGCFPRHLLSDKSFMDMVKDRAGLLWILNDVDTQSRRITYPRGGRDQSGSSRHDTDDRRNA